MEPLPAPFVPVPTRNRYAGWTEGRQIAFIEHLAETGSITQSAAAVGMSAASAYRLRVREGSENFAHAWDLALNQCGNQLLATALDRAINGNRQEYWRDGKLIGERTTPSDRLLIWAVERLLGRNLHREATPTELGTAIHAIHEDTVDERNDDYDCLLGEQRDAAQEAATDTPRLIHQNNSRA